MLSQKRCSYVSLHKSLIYTLHLASILTSLLRQRQELWPGLNHKIVMPKMPSLLSRKHCLVLFLPGPSYTLTLKS